MLYIYILLPITCRSLSRKYSKLAFLFERYLIWYQCRQITCMFTKFFDWTLITRRPSNNTYAWFPLRLGRALYGLRLAQRLFNHQIIPAHVFPPSLHGDLQARREEASCRPAGRSLQSIFIKHHVEQSHLSVKRKKMKIKKSAEGVSW